METVKTYKENKRLIIIFACLLPVFVIGCWFLTTAFHIPLIEWFIAGAISGYVINTYFMEEKKFNWKYLLLYFIFIVGGWPTFCLICIGLFNNTVKRTPVSITIAVIGLIYLYVFNHNLYGH